MTVAPFAPSLCPGLPPSCLSPVALSLPAGISLAAWAGLCSTLVSAQSAGNWWLGDWCNYGAEAYGEEAEQYLDQVPLASRKGYAWVAARITPERRREALTWSHHRLVAGLDATRADLLLDAAEREQWPAQRLREAIAEQDGKPVHHRADREAAVQYSAAQVGKEWTAANHRELCLYLAVEEQEAT